MKIDIFSANYVEEIHLANIIIQAVFNPVVKKKFNHYFVKIWDEELIPESYDFLHLVYNKN
jgi:hypothetical protein